MSDTSIKKAGFFLRCKVAIGLLFGLKFSDMKSARRMIQFRYSRYSIPVRLCKFLGWSLDQMWNEIPNSYHCVDLEGDIKDTPIWQDAENPLKGYPWTDKPDSEFPEEADVVVVGAGFGGSSIAYHWSKTEDEKTLVVLDGNEVASGAAGQNGGVLVMAGGHLHGYFVYETVIEYLEKTQPNLPEAERNTLAESFTDTYVNAMHASHEMIRETIEAEKLDVNYDRKGWVFFTDRENEHHVLASIKLAARLGHTDWEPRTAAEIKEKCGAQTDLDGAESLGSATWHPAKWVWAILGIAIKKPNINLYTQTLVDKVERDGEGYIVHTKRGKIRAKKVVNATEAHTVTLFKDFLEPFPNLILPHKEQAMHAVGGPETMKTGVGVTGPLGWFGRLPSGGIIFGSDNTPVTADQLGHTKASRILTRIRLAKICRVWGQAPIKLTHEWSGVTSDTPDKYPVVGSLDGHHLYMLGGFAGAGSACSFIAGETIMKYLLDKEDEVIHHPQEFFSPFRFTDTKLYGKTDS
ncbi:MAG: FAD-binding oxidoreductase [Lentisphaeria bacterium]|nr:FAD-binding oxidoreductase [Lentisphaeria bacterium]